MAKKLRQRPARVPLAQVFIERNGRGGGNIADRQAIKVVDHQAQQFASAAEHQVAARRVELPEQPAQQAAIQFDVVWRVQINLEIAFAVIDRKSTRLNSSHLGISYAVFCLKKNISP